MRSNSYGHHGRRESAGRVGDSASEAEGMRIFLRACATSTWGQVCVVRLVNLETSIESSSPRRLISLDYGMHLRATVVNTEAM